MNKDIDAQFLCKDCERYNLCQYYERRKEDSYICKYFHLSAEPCERCVSLQAALDAFNLSEKTRKYGGDHSGYDTMALYEIQDVLEDLPPVTPKQKMGRWIKEKKHHKDDFQEFDYWDVRCSECGARKRIGWTNIRHCPMCGAKMSENPTGSNSEEESEDTK